MRLLRGRLVRGATLSLLLTCQAQGHARSSATEASVPPHGDSIVASRHSVKLDDGRAIKYTAYAGLLPLYVNDTGERMTRPGIPNFEELSERLMRATGWQVVAVPGLVPDDVFFDHLANRRFVAGNFIRTPEQLDYLQEPDVFHDVFGHVLDHPADRGAPQLEWLQSPAWRPSRHRHHIGPYPRRLWQPARADRQWCNPDLAADRRASHLSRRR